MPIASKKKKLAAVVRNRLGEIPLPGDVRSEVVSALGLDKTAEAGSSRTDTPRPARVTAASGTAPGKHSGLIYHAGRTRKTSAERKRAVAEKLITVKRPRYVERRGVPYKRILDEKTKELGG
jgi:hypothetical protein